jgi:hypothetical protein
MLRPAILFLVLSTGGGLGAPVPKEVKRGVALEGSWEVQEFHMQGRPNNSFNGAVWKIGKDAIDIEHPAATGMTAMHNKINSVEITATSKNLDYTNSTGIDRKCIFEIDGDTMLLCIPLTSERPEELKPAQDNLFYKFKRVKE